MSIVVNKSDLAAAVAWAAKALPSRPAIPVLAGVKMTFTDGTLTVEAFDNEQSAVARTNYTADADTEPFTVIVSGRLMADLTRAMGGDTVSMTVDGTRLNIASGRSKFAIPALPTGEYPEVPAVPDSVGTITGEQFAHAVHRTAIAASKDDTLPGLSGVFMTANPETQQVTFAATDRYRLSVVTVPYVPTVGAREITSSLVPARVIDSYAKASENMSSVDLHLSESLFGLDLGNRTAVTRLLDADFPKYERLLPESSTAEATIDRHDLAAAVKRVALVADRSSAIKCSFTADHVKVSVGASNDSSASESVDADFAITDPNFEHDSFTIQFNPNYLIDGLNSVPFDRVKLRLLDRNKPSLIMSMDPSDTGKYLIMPVRSS